jgi:hypothetical protein
LRYILPYSASVTPQGTLTFTGNAAMRLRMKLRMRTGAVFSQGSQRPWDLTVVSHRDPEFLELWHCVKRHKIGRSEKTIAFRESTVSPQKGSSLRAWDALSRTLGPGGG